MTPLHSQVKQALLPVLLETTQKARDYREKLRKPQDEIYKKVEAVFNRRKDIVNKEYREYVVEMIAAATNQPNLTAITKANGSYAPLDPLTVLIPTEVSNDASSYGIITGLPYLVLHGLDKTLMAPDGHNVDNAYDVGGQYKSFPANDVEVESLLDNLTGPQLRFIIGNELFAPYLEAMFGGEEAEPTKVDPEVADEDNEEPPAF